MWRKIARLFVIQTRVEAWLIIYALAVGAMVRGRLYIAQYEGAGGWLLAAACTIAVFMGGAAILDATPKSRWRRKRRIGKIGR